MRVTGVAVRLLLCGLACGLLCGLLPGVACATTYYWISPDMPYDWQGPCPLVAGNCDDWWPVQEGYDNWMEVMDHDTGPPPAAYNIYLDHGVLNEWIANYLGACLRDDALNEWPAGCLNTYNMAMMGTNIKYLSGGVYAGRTFEAGYVDWNGWERTNIEATFGPDTSGWLFRTGPVYEFQSGTYATTPTCWDLTHQVNIPVPAFYVQSARDGIAQSTMRVDEVWVKVWNRDANWPATPEPTSFKRFFPAEDSVPLQWVRSGGASNAAAVAAQDGWYVYPPTWGATATDSYLLGTDIPEGDTTQYNRMQLVALVNTNDPPPSQPQFANFTAAYQDSEQYFGGRARYMVDLNLQHFTTRGAWRLFRGPIVRVGPWVPTYHPLETLWIQSDTPNLRVDQIYVRVWKQ